MALRERRDTHVLIRSGRVKQIADTIEPRALRLQETFVRRALQVTKQNKGPPILNQV